MLTGYEQARKDARDNSPIRKIKCTGCGRKIIVNKLEYGPEERKTFLCNSCTTLGIKESRRQFIQTKMKVCEVTK